MNPLKLNVRLMIIKLNYKIMVINIKNNACWLPIRPYLKNLVNDLKKPTDTWKNNLSVRIIFISSKNNGEEREMFLRNENVSVMIGNFTKILINVVFRSLFTKYQENLVENINRSDFIFEYVDRLYYGCQKKNIE